MVSISRSVIDGMQGSVMNIMWNRMGFEMLNKRSSIIDLKDVEMRYVCFSVYRGLPLDFLCSQCLRLSVGRRSAACDSTRLDTEV
jgi:hypothetical protein